MVTLTAELITTLTADAISAVARQLGTELAAIVPTRERRSALEIASAFNTYLIVDRAESDLTTIPERTASEIDIDRLRRNDIQALLQELFAVRLSDGPEATAAQLIQQIAELLECAQAETIAAVLDEQIQHVVVTIATVQPELLHRIRQEAFFTRVNATLEAIQRHLLAMAAPHDKVAETQFWRQYRQHVIKQHGAIEPPDFAQRRRVPIQDLYVAPRVIPMVQGDTREVVDKSASVDIFNPVQIDRTVLLGNPGGGKTTASNVLLYTSAADPDRRVPFLVTLRDFAADNPPSRSVVEFIEARLRNFYQCTSPSGAVERLMLSGNALVVFDGLDELLDTTRRADTSSIIENFCLRYPLTTVLVTSRLVGYSEARLDERQFTTLQVQGFGDSEVREYVNKWFQQEPDMPAADATAAAANFLGESADMVDLRSNPLMLALMCILYRGERSIPQSRSELYEKCADLLFRKWDAHRQIHVELRARHLIEPALRHLAYWLLCRDDARTAVTRRELISETSVYFSSRGFDEANDPQEAAEEFVDFCRGRAWVFSDVGTTAAGEPLYTFTHRTFLEYFAAYYLASTNESPEQLASTLAPRVAVEEWDMVGQLAVQIKDRNIERGAERIYVALMGERRRRTDAHRLNILAFLGRCLAGVQPRPSIVAQLTSKILAYLDTALDLNALYLALSSVVRNGHDCPEAVAEAVAARAAELVESSSRIEVGVGLELACCMSDGIVMTDHPFWRTYDARNIELYREKIIEEARGGNDPMLWTALTNGFVDADGLVSLAGGIGRLFNICWYKVYRFGRTSRVFYELRDAMVGNVGQYGLVSAIGRYVKSMEFPPVIKDSDGELLAGWLTGQPGYMSDDLPYDSVRPPSVFLPGDEYFGLLISAALGVEALGSFWNRRRSYREVNLARTLIGERLRSISEFAPYAMKRLGDDTAGELAPLPLEARFRGVFEAWAEGAVQFLAAEEVDSSSPG